MITTRAAGRPELPVGKIVAVGRNYADHAREMGAEPPHLPLLFLKPATALRVDGGTITLPSFSSEIHHEVELVVRLGRGGRNMDPEEAAAAVDAYGVGIDLTARDLQRQAKERGEPWAVAKGFDGSAPLSRLEPLTDIETLSDLEISLSVDGTERQRASTGDMLFTVAELVAFVSTRFSWEPGDLLFTGTPAGVGPLQAGQALEARVGSVALELGVQAASRST